MTAVSPRQRRAACGSPSRTTPRVVTFSPICPGDRVKLLALSSSCSSAWIRWTWRRLGWLAKRASRERALPVAPAAASPSTPSPTSSRIFSWFGLVSVWPGLRLTAATIELMISRSAPCLGLEQTESVVHGCPTYRRAVAGEDVPLGPARPIAPCQAENHEPDGLLGAAAARAGNADQGDGKITARGSHGARRHRRRGLGADRTMRGDGFGRNPKQFRLRVVRIGHKAALDDIRGAGDRRQRPGDEPPGAGFGGRNVPAAGPARIENRFGKIKGFSFEHRILRRAPAKPIRKS